MSSHGDLFIGVAGVADSTAEYIRRDIVGYPLQVGKHGAAPTQRSEHDTDPRAIYSDINAAEPSKNRGFQSRVHSFILMPWVGHSIHNFSDLTELVRVLRDVMNGEVFLIFCVPFCFIQASCSDYAEFYSKGIVHRAT